ncbi:MAG TPA: BACON domain-containing carbohydrate-binding protein [Vicinamibacterales bacterium]|nr:BACON domain-containing carbohydrate-binding protein [Vicinamibacterales bacterium]
MSLAGPDGSIGAGGGPGTVVVTTQPECAWTATAEASWITGLSPAEGQGSGQVQFQAAANPNGTARSGAINVNGQRATIQQGAAACQIDLSVSASQFPASGGAGSVSVATPGGCPWAAASTVTWITVAPAAGSGSGNVNFTVAGNTGAGRTGTITVGGLAVTIQQASGPSSPPAGCTISLQPTSTSIAAAGGTGSVAVTAGTSCPWTASALASWITLTTPASGSGNGSVGFSVAANTTTSSRSGTLNIGGQTFTVNQSAATQTCAVSINPTSQSVPATATTGLTVAVTAPGGCSRPATSNATWITVTNGATGSGNGTVTLNVAANTGGARMGTVTIGSQTFTVNQAGAAPTCTYSINPTAMTVGDDGAKGLTVAIATGAGCQWTSSENAGWLDIKSARNGTGSGSITFDVSSHNGTRTGTLTIAGQTFTVTQVQCTATLSPQSQPVSALGGTFTVSVTTQLGCEWQAVESLSWVTINAGSSSGTGSGTVSYTVQPNLAGTRSGNISIAGATLTVNQAAVLP